MSDAAPTDAPETEPEAEQLKPSETVDFWKQKAREQEKRAKENARAAERLAELEQAQMSEAEKAAERIRQLETQAEEARRDSLRYRVAAEFDIPGDKAELLLTGSDEETMRKQAEALRADTDERKKNGNVVPREGTASQPKADEVREFARSLFGRGD